MIVFDDLEFPDSVRLHYVYHGQKQMGVLMTPSSLPEQRVVEELARHGLRLVSGRVPMVRRVGEVANQFVQALREESDLMLSEMGNDEYV